jgi:phenylacetate-CoA ligase
MRRFDFAPPDRIRSAQWSALRGILKDAYDLVPFYRERFEAAGLRPDDVRSPDELLRLAPVARDEVAAHFPDRITAAGIPRDDWRFAATSGTTSQRMIVFHDFAKREAVRAAAVRSFRFTGLRLGSRSVEIPPDVCNVQCGLKREAEPSLMDYLRSVGPKGLRDREAMATFRGLVERQVVFRRVTLSAFDARGTCQPGEVLDEYVRTLAAARPALFKALPAYLLALACRIRRTGQEPPPVGEIRPMGSALAPSARARIAEAFRCPVVEDYGTAELGPIACECAPGSGLHLFSDLFYIEHVRDGARVGPGDLGRILITDLTNRAMPLIRYDIGDAGVRLDGPCPCGRGTERFRVVGRTRDILVVPPGRLLPEHTVTDYLYAYTGVEWFQILQRSDRRFDLQVAGDGQDGLSLEALSRDVAAYLGGDVRVHVRRVETIVPESGGKYRFMKSLARNPL